MRIHLLANTHRADAVEAASATACWLKERGIEVGAEGDTAPRIDVEPIHHSRFSECDLVITFGGDGTLIRAAHLCSERGTPILGVYYGRFGFVTQCVQQDLGTCLSSFFDNKVEFEDRMMLLVQLLRNGKVIAELHSLNEMALQRNVEMRMMSFEVHVDGNRLTSYPADGIIISTPTGSTAYNLSAGGPILDPNLEAIVLTALAPHTLSARPLVLKPSSELRIKVTTDGDAVLSADGQTRLHLLSGDEVRVTRSPRITRLLSVEKDDFLIKLGQRLFWSQGLIQGMR